MAKFIEQRTGDAFQMGITFTPADIARLKRTRKEWDISPEGQLIGSDGVLHSALALGRKNCGYRPLDKCGVNITSFTEDQVLLGCAECIFRDGTAAAARGLGYAVGLMADDPVELLPSEET